LGGPWHSCAMTVWGHGNINRGEMHMHPYGGKRVGAAMIVLEHTSC
jgi:hypothetical protein